MPIVLAHTGERWTSGVPVSSLPYSFMPGRHDGGLSRIGTGTLGPGYRPILAAGTPGALSAADNHGCRHLSGRRRLDPASPGLRAAGNRRRHARPAGKSAVLHPLL